MADELRLTVRVVPRASTDAIEVTGEASLRVRLRAPAIDGRANDALVRLLADALVVPAARVSIVTGARSRTKVVAIEGVSWPDVQARLASHEERR